MYCILIVNKGNEMKKKRTKVFMQGVLEVQNVELSHHFEKRHNKMLELVTRKLVFQCEMDLIFYSHCFLQ
jgi:hypothetical protein